MDDILYLEVDEEIPSVIEKLKKQKTDDVVLVVPAGAVLLSSVVNVKLLKRSADKENKRLAVVTTDPIGRHIATQVGVPVFVSVKDRRTLEPPRVASRPLETDELDLRESNEAADAGVPVHYYNESTKESKQSGQPQPAKAFGFAAHPVKNDPEPELKETSIERPASTPVQSRPSLPVDAQNHHVGESMPEYPKELPKIMKPAIPNKNRTRLIVAAIVSVIVLLGLGVGLWVYYPKVIVDLTVATEPYETKLNVIVDTSKQSVDDATGKTLAGEHLEGTAESTKDTPTTGKKDVGTAASGTVALQNRLGQAVKLSNGTTMASSGVTFTTTAEVTIPAATAAIDTGGNVTVAPGQITVNVAASQPGESGNLAKSAALTVQGLGSTVSDKVSATAQSAFSGGTSKQVNVATQADLDKAKQLASDDASNSAKTKVSGSLTGQQLLENASRTTVTSEEPSAKVGDQVDTISDKVSVKYEAFVFDPNAFKDAVTAQLNAVVPEGKMVVMTSADQITTNATGTDWSAGTLTLASDVKTQLSPHIDPATIVPLIRGKKVADAQAALQALSTIKSAAFTVRPTWLTTLPSRVQAYQIRFTQSDAPISTK